MHVEFERSLQDHRDEVYLLLRRLRESDKTFFLRSDLQRILHEFCESESGRHLAGTPIYRLLGAVQEAFFRDSAIYLDVRWHVAQRSFWCVHSEEMSSREISLNEFLRVKEHIAAPHLESMPTLEIDMGPFERGFPRLRDSRSIGHGVEFLNRYLCNRLFQDMDSGGQRLFRFLQLHRLSGQQLMLNSRLDLDEYRGLHHHQYLPRDCWHRGVRWAI